jgi:hypothetical protein
MGGEIVTAIVVIAIGAGALTLYLSARYAHDHVKTHGMHRIIGRALTGRRTDGKRHTTASFWRRSDGIVRGHPVGRVGNRHHRAGVANLFRTIGWVTGTVLTVRGLFWNRGLTIILVSVLVGLALAWKAYRGISQLRRWYIGRTVITPLADALGPVLELTGPEVERLIKLEPDYLTRKTGTIGRINVPTRFVGAGAEMETIKHLVSTRLPVGANLVPKMQGAAPHILINAAPELPSRVPFADYLSEIAQLGPGKYIPGITRAGDTYTAEFDGEDPHHGYSWGSGRGKSTILKSIIAQTFHNEPDATGTIIDPKMVSLDALAGIPGLWFYNDPSEFEGARNPLITVDTYEDFMPGMWQGIKSVYDLMNYRYKEIARDPSREFPTHYLVLEEANSFAIMSRTWWGKNRPKGMQGATPPIWADYIAPIFWRGRQANIKIVLVAQTIQERFLGNLNLRPSLGLISLSGFKANQWMNYIGTTPVPRAQRGKGRAIYAAGESETWVQCLLASDQEFHDFAIANRIGKKFPVIGHAETVIPEPGREQVTLVNPYGVPLATAAIDQADNDGPDA